MSFIITISKLEGYQTVKDIYQRERELDNKVVADNKKQLEYFVQYVHQEVDRWALPTVKKINDFQITSITNLLDALRMPAVKYALILGLKNTSLTQRRTCISVILVTGRLLAVPLRPRMLY